MGSRAEGDLWRCDREDAPAVTNGRMAYSGFLVGKLLRRLLHPQWIGCQNEGVADVCLSDLDRWMRAAGESSCDRQSEDRQRPRTPNPTLSPNCCHTSDIPLAQRASDNRRGCSIREHGTGPMSCLAPSRNNPSLEFSFQGAKSASSCLTAISPIWARGRSNPDWWSPCWFSTSERVLNLKPAVASNRVYLLYPRHFCC